MFLQNKTTVFAKTINSISIVLVLVLLVAGCHQIQFAAGEPDASGSSISADGSGSGDSNFAGTPKRQYFIAPRIGRSGNQQAAIWTALEEGALSSRGQMQPQRGFPNPMRSSLLYLISNANNRRLIGPRSGGLLPQARIGRRALPMGLMPQARVGRRSSSIIEDADLPEGAEFAGGQQEVAVATLSDSSLADALETLLDASLSTYADRSTQSDGQQETIQRPHRTTSFVPRLGKREQIRSDRLLELICAKYDCGQVGYDSSLPLATVGLIALETPESIIMEEPFVQQLKRSPRASEESRASIMQDLLSGTKRVAFTPRIGRK